MIEGNINRTLLDHEERISALEKRLRGADDSGPLLVQKKRSAKEFLMSKNMSAETQRSWRLRITWSASTRSLLLTSPIWRRFFGQRARSCRKK